MTLCECIPFTIPLSDDRTVCTLRDLPCLDKYKSACPLLWNSSNLDLQGNGFLWRQMREAKSPWRNRKMRCFVRKRVTPRAKRLCTMLVQRAFRFTSMQMTRFVRFGLCTIVGPDSTIPRRFTSITEIAFTTYSNKMSSTTGSRYWVSRFCFVVFLRKDPPFQVITVGFSDWSSASVAFRSWKSWFNV